VARLNAARNIAIEQTGTSPRDLILENEDLRFDFKNPVLERAIRAVLESGVGLDDPNLEAILDEEFGQQVFAADEVPPFPVIPNKPGRFELPETQEGVFEDEERDADIQTILSALDIFVSEGPGGLLEELATEGVPDLAATRIEPGDVEEPEPEEEETMSAFNPWGILDVITGVFEDAGPGDVFGPDLFDVIQLGQGIAGLFEGDVSVPSTITGEGNMAVQCAPGQRVMTPLQIVQACAKRKTGRSISKKGIKAMARVCGLDQTALTLGCPVTTICLVVASPTRRRTGISSADMRKTRSTIRKVKGMWNSLPTKTSAGRKR